MWEANRKQLQSLTSVYSGAVCDYVRFEATCEPTVSRPSSVYAPLVYTDQLRLSALVSSLAVAVMYYSAPTVWALAHIIGKISCGGGVES
jgi:hypothetical protein